MINKLLLVAKHFLNNTFYSIRLKKLHDGEYFIGESIPYQCQFATPELVGDILEKRIKGQDDPNWASFGFLGREEYAYWSWRACGIACLKMIIDFYEVAEKSFATLVQEGVVLGGYDVDSDKGWFYKPLLEQMCSYGLQGYIAPRFMSNSICGLILNKRFFIASVNPSMIRFDKQIANEEPGGHLVLVIGFKARGGFIEGFFIHNPSGKSDETRKRAFIPIDIFNKAYGKKGIAIWQ